MGLFNKNKPKESDVNKAADAFAAKDKRPPDTGDDGGKTAERVLGYSKPTGAETLTRPAGVPLSNIENLKRVREERKNIGKPAAILPTDEGSKIAAADAIAARKNIYGSSGMSAGPQLSAAERAEIAQKGKAELDSIVSNIKNEALLTEVGKYQSGNKAVAKNLSETEVDSATARFRNIGFITETQDDKKHLTAAEKLEQDLEELDSAEQAIASFTNLGFRNKIEDADLNENTNEEEEGGK